MSEWQPIGTVPDGPIEVDVWVPETDGSGGGYRVADAWREPDGRWRCHGDGGIRWAAEPTHWMYAPKPPPPAQSSSPPPMLRGGP